MPKVNAAGDPCIRPWIVIGECRRALTSHFGNTAMEEAIQLPKSQSQVSHYAKPVVGSGLAGMLLDIQRNNF